MSAQRSLLQHSSGTQVGPRTVAEKRTKIGLSSYLHWVTEVTLRRVLHGKQKIFYFPT